MFSWNNKSDRKAAHALLEKAAGREFATAKRRLAEQVEALVFRLPCGGLEGSLKNWNG